MRPFRLISHIAFVLPLLLAGCSVEGLEAGKTGEEQVVVSVSGCDLIDAVSKTAIGSDALSVSWEGSDKVYLWAEDSEGNRALDCQEFSVYGRAGSHGFFTSTLSNPMEEGSYTYMCCTPKPTSESRGEATFHIPFSQDGTGQGIMLAQPATGGALRTLEEYVEEGAVSMDMHQMCHLLQIYLKDDSGLLGGERLRRAVLTFPSAVVGSYSADLSSPSTPLSPVIGTSVLTVEIQDGLEASEGEDRHYVFVTIAPSLWKASDVISVKLYSDTKVAVGNDISLKGRSMLAGHATPVRLVPSKIKHYCHFDFTLGTNPIGEDVNAITLIAPDGCKWGDKGTNVYTYATGSDLPTGTTFEIGFEEEDLFHAFSGKTISVNFESEHVTMSSSFTLPDLTGETYSCAQTLDVPEILCENFDNVPSFSSDDEYKTSKAGSYSPHTFLNGWSAARAGAEAGKCIRIACRRETSADYDARADSAPLNCTFKKATDINVAFSFGSNNQYGGIAIITDGNVGQNCYLGYITTTKNYESGDGDGIFDRSGNSFYTKEYNGSWDNTPNDTDYTIKGIPAGASPVRITWHTEIEHQAGTTNTTAWLYIDNIKVTIAK